ncbi:TetR/AcrR family transcriptional regulator [Microbacterium marinilacus]|uniref:HTH tetR-type domain-containing protein n=1 Tax=Microbacterium marinilacus TaxID=415209 RepID=A0ABP7B7I5_9MICO|nr:TetR/AcrR family transcriptional regulator [Microbacterium marinilacus]MBY0687375.1 TetR/AcrR family transcriptional regulator [Microbacterium marinilacus]
MSEDPRQKRTRAALSEALLRQLDRGELSDISVASLCREAGVHRTTFYGHAGSIEEFAVGMITDEVDALATVDGGGPDARGAYRQAMVDLLAHIAGERRLYRALLGSRWNGALRVALDESMRARVRLALEVFAGRLGADVPDDREDVVAFVSGALVGVLVRWAESDDQDAAGRAAFVQALMPRWWPVR